jgi:hypothetical protein
VVDGGGNGRLASRDFCPPSRMYILFVVWVIILYISYIYKDTFDKFFIPIITNPITVGILAACLVSTTYISYNKLEPPFSGYDFFAYIVPLFLLISIIHLSRTIHTTILSPYIQLIILVCSFYFLFIWVNPNNPNGSCDEGGGCPPGTLVGLSFVAFFSLFLSIYSLILALFKGRSAATNTTVNNTRVNQPNQAGGRRR